MARYPSNLAKKFSPTEQFPQHILPLLPLYNAQWWGYESLTAIVLFTYKFGKLKQVSFLFEEKKGVICINVKRQTASLLTSLHKH